MRVQLAGVGKQHGAQVVRDQVRLTIGEGARLGLIGPNGVGKTTLLPLVAGDAHRRLPGAGAIVGDRDHVLAFLAHHAGIEQVEGELEAAAAALAAGLPAEDRYAAALERLVSLRADSFEARA